VTRRYGRLPRTGPHLLQFFLDSRESPGTRYKSKSAGCVSLPWRIFWRLFLALDIAIILVLDFQLLHHVRRTGGSSR